MKNNLPTRKQIREVRRLLETGLFSIPFIAHMTGVSLRDVFRIARAVRKNIKR